MYRDVPLSHVHELLDELLWPGHPLGSPIIGERKIISQLRREDLISFQKKYYTPSNIVIAACGRLEHQKILKRLKISLGTLEIKGKNTFAPARACEQKAKLRILKKRTHQTHLALGCYGINRDHPDKHILSLLHIILGANMSSRLFSELREKRGLAYQIGTQIEGFADTGLFLIHAGVDNTKMHQAISLIIKELGRIKNGLVSISELGRAKEFYTGQLRLALEDTLDHMFWIGKPTLHLNKTYNFNRILKDIKKIKPHDLRRVARDIFKPQAMHLAAIGSLKEEEKKLYACIRNL